MSVKVGDEIYLEEAWEGTDGAYHDEYVTVVSIDKDRLMKFRIDGKKNSRAKKIQAYLNKMDWNADDYDPLTIELKESKSL